ncbi:hypothetical protein HDU99_003532, partial [Rhizoclosmatium hyalinum]
VQPLLLNQPKNPRTHTLHKHPIPPSALLLLLFLEVMAFHFLPRNLIKSFLLSGQSFLPSFSRFFSSVVLVGVYGLTMNTIVYQSVLFLENSKNLITFRPL